MFRSRTIYYLILTFLLVVNHCPSQKKTQNSNSNVVYDSTYEVSISSAYPSYLINFHIEGGITLYGEPACMFSITTYSNPGRMLIDTVRYYRKDFGPDRLRDVFKSDSQARPYFVDVNFDGNLDIRMPCGESAREDLEYDFFLFNPIKNGYEFSQEFTDVCMNADIDPINKQISTTSSTERDCGYCWQESIYKVENNHPILYELVTSELIKHGAGAKQKETTKRMIKGKMAVTKVEYHDVTP
jgi:hypothetical protein